MAPNLLIFLRINWPQCVKSTAARMPPREGPSLGGHLQAHCEVQGISVMSQSCSVDGSSDSAFRCQYFSNLLLSMIFWMGRLKMRDMKIRDGQKCRGRKCEAWICGTNLQGWKMRDMKMRDQIAGVENAGKFSMESQSVKKCLKVVVFVCRVIPSV